jgi:tetratricopeptide (TPR) repeat protein
MDPDRSDILLEELARLREEVVNTRNLTIKSDNLIKNLSGEVKNIARRQGQQERKSLLNSVVAYVLFVVLILAGTWATFQARLSKVEVERTLYEGRQQELQRKLDNSTAELERWRQIERELLEFERLVKDGRKEDAVAAYSALKRLRFAGLLEDLIDRFKAEVAREEYERGIELYDGGNFGRADESFGKSLEYNEEPDYLGRLYYFQGMSAVHLKDFPRAAERLREALGLGLPSKFQAEASYHLAFAHDRMGERRTALNLYDRYVRRYSRHRFVHRAKLRHKRLSKRSEAAQ